MLSLLVQVGSLGLLVYAISTQDFPDTKSCTKILLSGDQIQVACEYGQGGMSLWQSTGGFIKSQQSRTVQFSVGCVNLDTIGGLYSYTPELGVLRYVLFKTAFTQTSNTSFDSQWQQVGDSVSGINNYRMVKCHFINEDIVYTGGEYIQGPMPAFFSSRFGYQTLPISRFNIGSAVIASIAVDDEVYAITWNQMLSYSNGVITEVFVDTQLFLSDIAYDKSTQQIVMIAHSAVPLQLDKFLLVFSLNDRKVKHQSSLLQDIQSELKVWTADGVAFVLVTEYINYKFHLKFLKYSLSSGSLLEQTDSLPQSNSIQFFDMLGQGSTISLVGSKSNQGFLIQVDQSEFKRVNPPMDPAVIAGIVVGCVAFLGLCSWLIFLWPKIKQIKFNRPFIFDRNRKQPRRVVQAEEMQTYASARINQPVADQRVQALPSPPPKYTE